MTLERRAVDLVASLSPWLAPLPTAWLVYDRTMQHLGWPQAVAGIAGIVVELLGIAIFATALMLYDYNGAKRKTDPTAPTWMALVLGVLYLLATLILVVVLDVWPWLATYAPAMFPLLSVAAFALLALRANHRRRLDAITMQKLERKAQRDETKRRKDDERRKELAQARKRVEAELQEVATWTKTAQVEWYAMQYPDWTPAELAEVVQCSPSTVTRALSKDGRKEPEGERQTNPCIQGA